ncbi:hypothetical protein TanjilG_28255 [Lupinus angustifolius]|uniref:AAA+ ATPase domain-containing protein n=1 Tax=Lupinus angustifolius TaxID=3871 RepID=A0A4P1RFC0_LUPAN|nr:PREDICTED: protein HYPER-SENSITIVITY-RELATED 4-like [Lupinus angustifolius]OIW09656.1 hypothetical protein TanjilG_28255 [Lupinus angustifolius]
MSFFSSSTTESKVAIAKTVLSTVGSVMATVVLVHSITNDLLPDEFHNLFTNGIRRLFSSCSSKTTMVFDEFKGLDNNEIYEAAEIYLGNKVPLSTQRVKVTKPDTEKNFTLTLDQGQTITDIFNDIKFNWILISHQVESQNFFNPREVRVEVRSFELTFHKKHKDMVLNTYLPFIINEANSLKQERRALKIFMLEDEYKKYYPNDAWVGTTLDHPSTFETVALDTKVKEFVLEDLKRFVKRKEYYRKVGKAWKRGYLLYGPPGTGKSSLIAAMANYLRFDIYDLELGALRSNSDLRKLFIGMNNRSILVVEDIDCTIQFHHRNATSQEETTKDKNNNQVTLSGLLNFIDGLWSSCGDERIIVFTTNHKQKLDPALLRPGRMDVHIHMSYCTSCVFRHLVKNYLDITEHSLFQEIEEELQKTHVTPAEVAEQLLKSCDMETTLKELVDFLRRKKENQEQESKDKEEEK